MLDELTSLLLLLTFEGGFMLVRSGRLLIGCAGLRLPAMSVPEAESDFCSSAEMDLKRSSYFGRYSGTQEIAVRFGMREETVMDVARDCPVLPDIA